MDSGKGQQDTTWGKDSYLNNDELWWYINPDKEAEQDVGYLMDDLNRR